LPPNYSPLSFPHHLSCSSPFLKNTHSEPEFFSGLLNPRGVNEIDVTKWERIVVESWHVILSVILFLLVSGAEGEGVQRKR